MLTCLRMDRGGADLMIKLLRLDPVRRLSAAQALEHDWFRISPKPANKAPYVSVLPKLLFHHGVLS